MLLPFPFYLKKKIPRACAFLFLTSHFMPKNIRHKIFRNTEIKHKLQIIIRTAAAFHRQQYLNQRLPFRNSWNAVALAATVPIVQCQHIFVPHPIWTDCFCQRKISPVFTSVTIVCLRVRGDMIWNCIWNRNMEYIRQFNCWKSSQCDDQFLLWLLSDD